MNVVEHASGRMLSGNPASAVFEREWQLYGKMIDNNYLFHREAYACLREIVLRELARPFRFLDIACGDASVTVGALAGTSIAHYYGIDLPLTRSISPREISSRSIARWNLNAAISKTFLLVGKDRSTWPGSACRCTISRLPESSRSCVRSAGSSATADFSSPMRMQVRTARIVPLGFAAGPTKSTVARLIRPMSGEPWQITWSPTIFLKRARIGATLGGTPVSAMRGRSSSRRPTSIGCTSSGRDCRSWLAVRASSAMSESGQTAKVRSSPSSKG